MYLELQMTPFGLKRENIAKISKLAGTLSTFPTTAKVKFAC